ncbi:MAG: hypothetical protein AB8F65_07570 [Woeseiaceae bacterium]
MAKSAKEKLNAEKASKTVVLEKDFAGVRKGQTLFIATPKIVDHYLREIPYGETRTIQRLRRDLARRHQCDASCPVSTAIFIRVAAQAAIDEMAEGAKTDAVTPFWRLLTGRDKITKKLEIDAQWLDTQRASEKT